MLADLLCLQRFRRDQGHLAGRLRTELSFRGRTGNSRQSEVEQATLSFDISVLQVCYEFLAGGAEL